MAATRQGGGKRQLLEENDIFSTQLGRWSCSRGWPSCHGLMFPTLAWAVAIFSSRKKSAKNHWILWHCSFKSPICATNLKYTQLGRGHTLSILTHQPINASALQTFHLKLFDASSVVEKRHTIYNIGHNCVVWNFCVAAATWQRSNSLCCKSSQGLLIVFIFFNSS